MQEVLPLGTNPGETQSTQLKRFLHWGITFLCWASPFIGFSVFFPLGVLVLYPKNRKLRSAAFLSFILQVVMTLILYPLDLIALYSFELEALIMAINSELKETYITIWAIFGLILLFIEARYTLRKKGELHLEQPVNYTTESAFKPESEWTDSRKPLPGIVRPNYKPPVTKANKRITYNEMPSFDQFTKTLFSVLVVWGASIIWFLCLSYFFVKLNRTGAEFEELKDQIFKGESLYLWFMILASSMSFLSKKAIPVVLRRLFLSLYLHTKLALRPTEDFFGDAYANKKKYARMREFILPGWGQIYLQRYWKGFPILFIFLLTFFFFSLSVALNIDISFGIKFMGSFGLKPGISDKEFIEFADNIIIPFALFAALLVIYIFANTLILNSIKRDGEPMEERGIQTGFANNLSLSLLMHLILFAIILIIPISVQRQNSKKKKDMSKQHYQPENMEYFFVDPEIPDEVKDLNGTVIAGTETPSQKDGIKIPDNPVEDQGKVKGFVKRVKGKKLPRTYSNYISARMRGPENFMEYWKRAPHPYSCVVAYTITTDGDIIDVILVEGSAYPDQDDLTLELIRSMSPVMPPPNVKGDVRVTELFWNGSIDPDAMPTPLQKEMVLHFDGRYMEEEF